MLDLSFQTFNFCCLSHRANKINPNWVALKKSRGHESLEHKLFMRYTGNIMTYMFQIDLTILEYEILLYPVISFVS